MRPLAVFCLLTLACLVQAQDKDERNYLLEFQTNLQPAGQKVVLEVLQDLDPTGLVSLGVDGSRAKFRSSHVLHADPIRQALLSAGHPATVMVLQETVAGQGKSTMPQGFPSPPGPGAAAQDASQYASDKEDWIQANPQAYQEFLSKGARP
ncbi:MAG TPA: hypothetical protein P5027_07245 [Flavobacteriales bacterium]|nr:hypothetical protein [Flavobacteriales bacterium]